MRGLSQGSFAISTIIEHLTQSITDLVKDKHEVYLYFNDPVHKTKFSSTAHKRSAKISNRFVWDHFWLPGALKKDKIDFALFFKGTIPLLVSCKTGVLFHDLGYFNKKLNPYKKLETIYMKLMMAKAAVSSNIIFSVSEYTKTDLVNYFSIDPEKILVCYANSSSYFEESFNLEKPLKSSRIFNLPKKYIFWPTSISPRKNIYRVLNAFQKTEDYIPHHLVLTGGKFWNSNSEIKRIHKKTFERVHVLGNISTEELLFLYKNASFTIYPSLLEGFGIPILEAWLIRVLRIRYAFT